MDWLRAVVGILVVVVLALLIGKTQNSKRTAVHVSVWVGSILVLLALRFGFTSTWEFSLLLLAFVFHSIDSLPPFIRYAIAVTIIFWLAEYRVGAIVTTESRALAAEIEKTNARITLMENSITNKLDDIQSRMPEND